MTSNMSTMTSVNIIQSCTDVSDIVPLYPQQGLFLKPVAKLNISVHLPTLKLPGKTISNWEVMEKLKYWTIPDEFTSLKVSKNTLEFIRFEAEIESRSKLPAVLARLDGRFIKISGFTESLKVRAAEVKCDFPTRHHWDSYFRDAKNMNEMKPGERPDTIHITNLPCKWFASKSDPDKPSEYILRKVFETFGEVRCVDIPSIDLYRNRMKAHISGVKMFSYHQNIVFEGYIQFKEYVYFMKAMDTLRGMKLIYKEDTKIFSASIKIDFDKTKHLSDSSIRKRRTEREKLMAEEREHEEQERMKKEKEEAEKEAERKRKIKEKEEKLERRKQREEKRKLKQLEILKAKEAEDMNRKIASEERLLLMAQRRLESIRLLNELIRRVEETTLKKIEEKKEFEKNIKKDKGKSKGKESDKLHEHEFKSSINKEEEELRQKLIKKLKSDDSKKCTDKKDQEPGSSKALHVLASSVSGAVPVSSSSDDDVASLITSSESDMSDLNGKNNRGKKEKQPLPDSFPNVNRNTGAAWYPHSHNSGIPYNPFPLMGNNPVGYSRPPHRSFYPRGRRGFRWPRYPVGRGRGGYIAPTYIDPLLLDINHQYYKYFHKLTHGKTSKSSSRSYSRSHSRSTSRSRSYSRRYSRSKTRSRTLSSRSRSRSRSFSRSRKYSERSRSSRSKSIHSKRSKKSKSHSSRRSRSMSSSRHRSKHSHKSRSRSRSHSKKYSHHQHQSSHSKDSKTQSNCRDSLKCKDNTKRKTRWDTVTNSDITKPTNSSVPKASEVGHIEEKNQSELINSVAKNSDVDDSDEESLKCRKSPVRFPSVAHTWSRSPSHSRSLSWEKNGTKDKQNSSTHKNHLKHHKKERKKSKKKKVNVPVSDNLVK